MHSPTPEEPTEQHVSNEEAERHQLTRNGIIAFGNSMLTVVFRAGLLACREYMARFVEAQDKGIATSIRANWWPSLGADPGPPRRNNFAEWYEGEYPNGRCVTPEASVEALPHALHFLQQLGYAAPAAEPVAQQPPQQDRARPGSGAGPEGTGRSAPETVQTPVHLSQQPPPQECNCVMYDSAQLCPIHGPRPAQQPEAPQADDVLMTALRLAAKDDPLAAEAAERIRTLEAENTRLMGLRRKDCAAMDDLINGSRKDADELAASRERIRTLEADLRRLYEANCKLTRESLDNAVLTSELAASREREGRVRNVLAQFERSERVARELGLSRDLERAGVWNGAASLLRAALATPDSAAPTQPTGDAE